MAYASHMAYRQVRHFSVLGSTSAGLLEIKTAQSSNELFQGELPVEWSYQARVWLTSEASMTQ